MPKLLTVDHLTLGFEEAVVRGVSFEIDEGERVALVGESGSGKSLTAQAILRLNPHVRTFSGEVFYAGQNLTTLSPKGLRAIRGREIGFAFQDPFTALDPTMKVGQQIAEGMRRHLFLTRQAAYEEAIVLLEHLEFHAPEEVMEKYPFELSGGMRQRIVLAIAIAARPVLLIADEPTTALDVSVQAEILALLKTLCQRRKMGLLFITHDLQLIPKLCEKVVVMYAGEVVEQGRVEEVWRTPKHPYTQALLQAIPKIDQDRHAPLKVIPGQPPLIQNQSPGCAFAPRCSIADVTCHITHPPLENNVRCWRAKC